MRSTDCFVNGQSPNSYAELTLFLFRLRNEASHKPVGDSGANPNFREKVVGVLVDGKKIDGIVIKRGNDHINDENHPQIAPGITLPVLAGIEVREHEEQQHRAGEARQMDGKAGKWRRKKNVAQQHSDAYAHRAPVVEPLGVKAVDKEHPHHHQASDVEDIKHKFRPRFLYSEMDDSIEHNAHGEQCHRTSKCDVDNFRFLFESGFHVNSLMNLMHNAAMLRSKVTKKARKNSTSKDEKIKKTEKMAVDTASDHPRHPFGI